MNQQVRDQLTELRASIEDARSMPMSGSCVISRSEVLQRIGELEAAFSRALSEAEQITARRDQFVLTGQQEARRLIEDAQSRHEDLISETAVFREASRRAEATLADAGAEAQALRAETDNYVEARLGSLESSLRSTLESVERGRERLNDRMQTPTIHDEPPEQSRFSSLRPVNDGDWPIAGSVG
ncbi:MAG: hypothetical protein ACR2FL_00500 [Nocardioidaceae bacterium]